MLIFQTSVLVAIVTFVVLALLARTTAYFSIDLTITHTLQSLRSPEFDALMQAISWPGYEPQAILLVAAVVLPMYVLGFRWEAVMSVLSSGATHLLNLTIKAIVHRPRPSADIVHAFKILEDFSFPSGHVMFFLGFFGFLWFLAYALLSRSWKRTLLLLLLGSLVGLVGLSRIYLGEHWASDVLGAYIAGSLALAVAIQAYRWGAPRFTTHPTAATKPGRDG